MRLGLAQVGVIQALKPHRDVKKASSRMTPLKKSSEERTVLVYALVFLLFSIYCKNRLINRVKWYITKHIYITPKNHLKRSY